MKFWNVAVDHDAHRLTITDRTLYVVFLDLEVCRVENPQILKRRHLPLIIIIIIIIIYR